LQFILEDKTTISIRPSGTEPKIKFYFSVNTTLNDSKDFDKTTLLLEQKIDGIMEKLEISN